MRLEEKILFFIEMRNREIFIMQLFAVELFIVCVYSCQSSLKMGKIEEVLRGFSEKDVVGELLLLKIYSSIVIFFCLTKKKLFKNKLNNLITDGRHKKNLRVRYVFRSINIQNFRFSLYKKFLRLSKSFPSLLLISFCK